MQKTFCDRCGIGVDSWSPGTMNFGVAPTTNYSSTDKFIIRLEIYPIMSGKLAELCYPCKRKIITDMVKF